MAGLELYVLPGCPYCRKVQDKLDELGLEYEEHRVPADHARRETVRELSGQTGVPVLSDSENGIEGMAESEDIVRYLEATYGN